MNTFVLDDLLDVVVIGAGMAGLACARALQDAGHRVVVLEQDTFPGGRVKTDEIFPRSAENSAPIIFDTGAQNIKSHDTALGEAIAKVLLEDDFRFVDKPIALHEDNRIVEGDPKSNAQQKWSCRGGLQFLPRALAADLDVRYNTEVQRIEETPDGFLFYAEEGAIAAEAQRVVITVPAPQAAILLQNSQWQAEAATIPERVAALQTIEYSRCLSVQLHFAAAHEELPWYALLARDRSHPLLWLACENAKEFVPRGAGTALMAQLGHEASCDLWDESDETIAERATQWISEIMGADFRSATQFAVRRWHYSQPRSTIEFDAVNPPTTRVVVCGDATTKGHVPEAYESGLLAAARIMNK